MHKSFIIRALTHTQRSIPSQVDCESAEAWGLRDAPEVSECERLKSRVHLFRLHKIAFNLHNVGAKYISSIAA